MKIAKYTALGNHFVVVDELGGEVVEEGHKLAFARFSLIECPSPPAEQSR